MLKWLLVCMSFTAVVWGEDAGLMERTFSYAKGHQDFRNLFFKQNEKEFVRLIKEGQSPKALFISCSDSRVEPSLILNSRPGDLFAIRTAGNFVPTYDNEIVWDGVAASIEYAVEVLGVKDVIVCGHSHCGAVKGLFQNLEGPKFALLRKWLRFGQEAKSATLQYCKLGDEGCMGIAERISVVYQLNHLTTYPFIKKKVEDKTLSLHAWYYIIETGEIQYYNAEENKFQPL